VVLTVRARTITPSLTVGLLPRSRCALIAGRMPALQSSRSRFGIGRPLMNLTAPHWECAGRAKQRRRFG
jgi:hypothetical protein